MTVYGAGPAAGRDPDQLAELIERTQADATAIADMARRLLTEALTFSKLAGEDDATVIADVKAVSAAAESLRGQISGLDLAASVVNELGTAHLDPQDPVLADEVTRALNGESVLLYAVGTLPETARFAASVHGLLGDDPLTSFGNNVYVRGSLFGFLFRGNAEASSRLAGKARDALVGKTSAEMTHEDVRSYREFAEATQALPSAILITRRFAFAKVAEGVFAFELDRTRKAVLENDPTLVAVPETFVERMREHSLNHDVALPSSQDRELEP